MIIQRRCKRKTGRYKRIRKEKERKEDQKERERASGEEKGDWWKMK